MRCLKWCVKGLRYWKEPHLMVADIYISLKNIYILKERHMSHWHYIYFREELEDINWTKYNQALKFIQEGADGEYALCVIIHQFFNFVSLLKVVQCMKGWVHLSSELQFLSYHNNPRKKSISLLI